MTHNRMVLRLSHGHARQSLRWPTLLVVAAVLALAILNPALCILHCSLAHEHDSRLVGDQRQFLCDLENPVGTALSAPFSAVWSSPRAVYEALPTIPVLLTIIVVVVIRLRAAAIDAPSVLRIPAFPPPKPMVSA